MTGVDTRHSHGTMRHDHDGGESPHNHKLGDPKLSGPPPSPKPYRPYRTLVSILLVLVALGAAMSFCDPHLNFPVVSQAVCSLKGDTWYGGGLLGPPGCYAP